ncbi:SGNH hydrolase [Patellaria atrata CBS 101060]|uniref:SGNH hydrolase n=1 Tax=Patellaria atrata CBS 101060 TaxID=1346257 RepID=A0A9P4SB84_9PEZI|nr:SGNH hydrolase [Patellaria atrata CBS 101060]
MPKPLIEVTISCMLLRKIILFGDSLTEWSFEEHSFGIFLQQYYAGKADAVNKGQNLLDTSRFQLILVHAQKYDEPPLFITIFLGANYACLPDHGMASVPLEEFEENLRAYVDVVLTASGWEGTKVILITPPPINIRAPRQSNISIGPVGQRSSHSRERRAFANDALDKKGRAKIQNGEFDYDEDRLPGCGLKTASEFQQGIFTDGLHLDRLGYGILFREFMNLLLAKWPELARDQVETRVTARSR